MKNMWLLKNYLNMDIRSEDDALEKNKYRNCSPC